MKYFITYGDIKYEYAKARITNQARNLNVFDEVISYSPSDLSPDLLQSDVFKINRGGGLWSWKPDVILKTMNLVKNGDIIVYCDSGCTLSKSREWLFFWEKLENHDLIVSLLYNKVLKWTRKEILNDFKSNGKYWTSCHQFLAGILIIKVSDFTRLLISDWRDYILYNPSKIMDVPLNEKQHQHPKFIENRHDQSVLTAFIYKYLHMKQYKSKIYVQWEHVEDYDIFFKQAIQASRLRTDTDRLKNKYYLVFKRILKDVLLRPYSHILQTYYMYLNNH